VLTKRKRTLIEQRLRAESGLSNRALAREFAVDDKTIANIRRGLNGAEIPHAKLRLRKRAPGKGLLAQLEPKGQSDDPPADDPAQILREIAADPKAPAIARVQAAKAMIAMQKPTAAEKAAEKVDWVTARALQIIDGGKA
jgi:hypothetical protein